MLVHQRVSLKYGTKKSAQNQPDEPPTIQNPPAGRCGRAAAGGAWRAPSAGGLSVETWLADASSGKDGGPRLSAARRGSGNRRLYQSFNRVLTCFNHSLPIIVVNGSSFFPLTVCCFYHSFPIRTSQMFTLPLESEVTLEVRPCASVIAEGA